MYDDTENKHVDIKCKVLERDLGVYIDKELKFTQHTITQVNKANRLLGIIRRSYTYLDASSFKNLFVTLVRPHLEYCNARII